jgi:hypothetical protein
MTIVIKEIHVKTTIERTGVPQQEWFMEEMQKLKRSMQSEINEWKRQQTVTRKKR